MILKLDDDWKSNLSDWTWPVDLSAEVVEGIAETIEGQFREDGVEVVLWNSYAKDGSPRIVIDLLSLSTRDEVMMGDNLRVGVDLSELLDELIESEDGVFEARELIPAFRAMLAKLEALPES